MLSAEQLFVRRYDEVKSGLQARDDFDRLKMAAALRQLLVDKQPLVHAANRNARIKFQFTVNDLGTIADVPVTPDVMFHGHDLDPSVFHTSRGLRHLKLDQFLSMPVLESPQRNVSVQDIVKFVANKAGGVHFDLSRSDDDVEAERVLLMVSRIGVNSVAVSLEAIARITMVALQPLRQAIVKLPSHIQLFAHHALDSGTIEFTGLGQFLETNLTRELKQGWGWHGVVRVMPQAESGERVLYELGNSDGSPPRITLLTDDSGDLLGRVRVDRETTSEVRAKGFRGTVLFDRFTYVAFEVGYGSDIETRLLVNNRLAALDRVNSKATPKSVSRHTIGADLSGKNSATFQLSELVIADMLLDDRLRTAVAEYFWLQWHG